MTISRLWLTSVKKTAFTALVLLVVALNGSQIVNAATQELVILFMNDPHAHYEAYAIKGLAGLSGGFAKAQTVMQRERLLAKSEGVPVISLMAGDLLMGTPFSTFFKGKVGTELLNKMNFEAMVVGNHEFDYGLLNLVGKVKGSLSLPLLSANIRTSHGDYLFQRTLTLELPYLASKIFLIGLTTPETPVTTFPSNVTGLEFEDPISVARELLKDARQDDLVIALTHLGIEQDRRLASNCPLIDIIIGGHSHTAIFHPVVENGVIICQAGAYAEYVGKLKILADRGKITQYQSELIRLTPDIPEDETISSIIKGYREKLDKSLQSVIGKTEVNLEGRRSVVRSDMPTNLGQLIAYIMMSDTGTEAAVINGGAIRASIDKGEITQEMIYTVLPFANTVVRMDLRGEDIDQILRRSLALDANSGGKLQSFGIEIAHTPTGPIIKKIGHRAFDPHTTYKVAVSNFLAAGGDGYLALRDKQENAEDSFLLISDLFAQFIQSHEVVTQQLLDSLLRTQTD